MNNIDKTKSEQIKMINEVNSVANDNFKSLHRLCDEFSREITNKMIEKNWLTKQIADLESMETYLTNLITKELIKKQKKEMDLD